MLSGRFFETISRLMPVDALSGKENEIAKLNPDKIYVENVRAVLGVSYASAVRICEMAVRQGLFERGIEVLCPDGSVATSADSEASLPETVTCWKESDGEVEEEKLATASLGRIVFYRLNDRSASFLYRPAAENG